jgi:hypothetical protein
MPNSSRTALKRSDWPAVRFQNPDRFSKFRPRHPVEIPIANPSRKFGRKRTCLQHVSTFYCLSQSLPGCVSLDRVSGCVDIRTLLVDLFDLVAQRHITA